MKNKKSKKPGKLRSWWEHKVLYDSKDWMQIEVTSRCNALCSYCPRTVYHKQWKDRSMPMETFKALLPALQKTDLAYLQGWGEPLLHKDFPEMVRLAKEAGCTVGVTTNGILLRESLLEKLIESGLDILAFSLAGTTAATNDPVRAGAPFEKVMEKLDLAKRIKEKGEHTRPVVHIAYMLLRSGLDDLEKLPELMHSKGVDQAVVSVLDFEPGVELSSEVLSPENENEIRELESIFSRLKEQAKEKGQTIHTPVFSSSVQDGLVCSENVEHALFVSAQGDVSPCVYANVPVDKADFARQGQPEPYSRNVFGNINNELLPVIWRCKGYTSFREGLKLGRPARICQNCPKRRS
ncbi:radical SAM protein [Desulfonatronovibrio magnus]|uniref:radical SAM protein n=1 Tax=Desulfonatronovibrio magnus TaxID=698827 RepID=UPI000696D21E|nr:radical SAM protein [Desulfonatronovibrio magnus]